MTAASGQAAELIIAVSDRSGTSFRPDSIPSGKRPRAWYFGTDLRTRNAVETQWGESLRFESMAAPLGRIVDRIVPDIVNLDRLLFPEDELPRAYHEAWLASDLCDRGPYATRILEEAAKLILLHELTEDGGLHIAVFDDPARAGAFYHSVSGVAGLETHWQERHGRRHIRDEMTHWGRMQLRTLRMFASRVYRGAQLIWRIVEVKLLRRAHPINRAALAGHRVMIASWADERTFSPTGRAEEITNLGRLPEILRENDLDPAYVATPLSWIGDEWTMIRSMVGAKDAVLTVEDCIGVGDILAALFESMRLKRAIRKRLKDKVRVDGRDITAILELALQDEQTKWRPVRSALYRCVARKLKSLGCAPRTLLYPFEGQPWEKSLISGFRTYLPDCAIVGYQYGAFAPNHISLYPSAREIQNGVAPDKLLVAGPRYGEWFQKNGFPQSRMFLGGGLRHERRMHQASTHSSTPAPNSAKTVLCCCSIDIWESLDLLDKTARALEAEQTHRLLINFHPMTPDSERRAASELKSVHRLVSEGRAELSDDSFADLIHRADIVIYDRSGAVFESMQRGIPAVHVGIDSRLNMNKIVEPEVPVCHTVDELRAVLNGVAAGDSWSTIVRNYLHPVDIKRIVDVVSGARIN